MHLRRPPVAGMSSTSRSGDGAGPRHPLGHPRRGPAGKHLICGNLSEVSYASDACPEWISRVGGWWSEEPVKSPLAGRSESAYSRERVNHHEVLRGAEMARMDNLLAVQS
jgi:hypothetical protein